MSSRRRTLPTLLGLLTLCGCADNNAITLAVGQIAPPFELQDQNGTLHRLSDYAGKWLVMYFYPKDDTPGCTKEACHFRDDIVHLHSLGVQLVGISLDSAKSHVHFAKKFNLPFPLLVDKGGSVAKQYGSYWSFAFFHVARRHTFIIDPTGHIAKIYRKVDPDNHSAEVIADIKALQQAQKS